jgi:hypothetical protein
VDGLLFIVVVFPGQRKRKRRGQWPLEQTQNGRELTNA